MNYMEIFSEETLVILDGMLSRLRKATVVNDRRILSIEKQAPPTMTQQI